MICIGLMRYLGAMRAAASQVGKSLDVLKQVKSSEYIGVPDVAEDLRMADFARKERVASSTNFVP